MSKGRVEVVWVSVTGFERGIKNRKVKEVEKGHGKIEN
jgi:hypothetical protein